MLARVVTLEGGTPDSIRAGVEDMRERVPSGPPPGVKSSGFTMLVNPEGGKVIMIGLFDSEEDLRQSDAVLEQMDRPDGLGERTSKEVFEVGAEMRM